MIKLARDLDFEGKESFLGTICLPEKEDLDRMADEQCIATGWGVTNAGK